MRVVHSQSLWVRSYRHCCHFRAPGVWRKFIKIVHFRFDPKMCRFDQDAIFVGFSLVIRFAYTHLISSLTIAYANICHPNIQFESESLCLFYNMLQWFNVKQSGRVSLSVAVGRVWWISSFHRFDSHGDLYLFI